MEKTYLGDGVYVELDETMPALVLTTENGIETTNRIVLDSSVYASLVQFAMRATVNTTPRGQRNARDLSEIFGDLT